MPKTGNYVGDLKILPIGLNKKFINNLGISQNNYTTQIEPHDYICEINNMLSHLNSVLIGFSQDMWTYISKNYFIQKNISGEIGSSTMPHKINPINFENAEGNLGLANSMLRFLSEKLTISRLQRDLSDSTVMRNLGVGFSYSFLAYENLILGLNKLKINKNKINDDIDNSWELLAAPIQMIARKYNISMTRLHKHIPYAHRKSNIINFEKEFPAAFKNTINSPSRSNQDINVMSFAAHYFGLIHNKVPV